MDEYINSKNMTIISIACNKMLNEKFGISLTEDQLLLLVKKFSNDIKTEYASMQLSIKELNNITLSKIKLYYQEQLHLKQEAPLEPVKANNIIKIKEQVLDTQELRAKIENLERGNTSKMSTINIAPKSFDINEQLYQHSKQQLPSQLPQQQIAPPIKVTLSSPEPVTYKTLIINSINRDWAKFPNRNNHKFSLPIDINLNKYFIDSICFPEFVKQITSYVLVNISDGNKSVFYSCIPHTIGGKWDIWKPVDNAEHINLENKTWAIKFYDVMNTELMLGSDNINVLEASKDNAKYILKIDQNTDNFRAYDTVSIKINSGRIYNKKIINYDNNVLTILDDTKELQIDDFINSKILNVASQYSIIIKYHCKK